MTALPAPTTNAVHLRITRRGRVVLAALASLPLVAALIALAVFGANSAVANGAETSAASQSFDYVTVQAGETLWGIAEEMAPTADPRDVIADIVSLNQLPSSEVQPGQRLAVPGKY